VLSQEGEVKTSTTIAVALATLLAEPVVANAQTAEPTPYHHYRVHYFQGPHPHHYVHHRFVAHNPAPAPAPAAVQKAFGSRTVAVAGSYFADKRSLSEDDDTPSAPA
jgi:hypothetical protein